MEKRIVTCLLFSGAMMALPCQESDALETDGEAARTMPVMGPRIQRPFADAGPHFLTPTKGPDPGIDFKLIVKKPDPAIQYFMMVVDPGRKVPAFPEAFGKKLREQAERLGKRRIPR
jgi:hypothetical protein